MKTGHFDINIDTNMTIMKNNESSLNLSDINTNSNVDKIEFNEEDIKFDDLLNEVEKDDYMILVDEADEKKLIRRLLILLHLIKEKIILFQNLQEKILRILKKNLMKIMH